MADKKKRAPLPPSQSVYGTQTGVNHVSVREINNPAYVEVDGLQQDKKLSLPLPDYETLFPQKRHGVQGQTRWDHIIAEVNQRHMVGPPEFLGPEMSVDDPAEPNPTHKSSLRQESPAIRHYQKPPQETKPVSSKRVAAPAPPKSVTTPHPRSVPDSSQRQSQNNAHQSLVSPNQSAVPGPVNTDASNRESLSVRSRDGVRKALQPPAPRPTSQMDWDTTMPDDQRKMQVTVNKEAPTAKPRQRVSGKEPLQQEDSAGTPAVSLNTNIQTLSNSSMSSMDKKGVQTTEDFAGFDPFPNTELVSKDPWAQPKQNQEVDYLFTSNVQEEQKLEDRGMTADDLDNIFRREIQIDPFAGLNGSDSNKHNNKEQGNREKDENSKQVSPAFQRRNSQRRTQIPPSSAHPDNKSRQEPAYKEEKTITTANQGLSARNATNEYITLKLQAEVKTPSNLYRREDQFGAEPFTVTSASTSSDPLQVVMEEPESQTVGLSGGKTLLRAWVSPSDVQPVSAQSSNGGGLGLTRRPHPVKPMNSVENQHPISTPAVKEIKVRDSTPGKIQVADSGDSGPYTQLTQEELITMVVKQQTDLSRKDAKIVELEEYIDNLLVRVIEEKPTILQSLNAKPV